MSVGCVVAYSLWVASLGLCLIGWGDNSLGLRVLSVIIGMAAVTATVRTYFVVLGYRIKAALIVAATEGPGSVTSLR